MNEPETTKTISIHIPQIPLPGWGTISIFAIFFAAITVIGIQAAINYNLSNERDDLASRLEFANGQIQSATTENRQLRTQVADLTTQRNDAIDDYNQLVTQYNELQTQAKQLAAAVEEHNRQTDNGLGFLMPIVCTLLGIPIC